MSTTSYDPNEAYLPAARAPRKQRPTNAGSNAGNLLGSQLLSRSSVHYGNYVCGRSEVSDDDLITAAQRGDQQAFVDLCARHSALAKKKKPSLRSVVNHYYGSECSLEEAAKAQEISLGAAKSRLLRGRVRLRASLARYGISKSRN